MAVIGHATGIFFGQKNITSVVVGRDVRNSSARIQEAISTGLIQAGLHVIDIGLVPTPVLNFATDFYQAGAGVMITASHNPPEYNGLKIRTDRTLYGDELQEIYQIALTVQNNKPNSLNLANTKIEKADPLPVYLNELKALARFQASVPTTNPLKTVVDGGNGANGILVAQLLRDLGLDVIELYCELDGNFFGRGPDPTSAKALTDLSKFVQAQGADLGLAYDGDGDRLALVDERGNRVLGDQIMMILARDILHHGPAKIVYEILCTQALADDVLTHGGEPVMTPSGYAFVHEAMHKVNGVLGGELSGHLFFNEAGFRFDDAILATIKLLNVLAKRNKSLSGIVAELPTYHSSPQLRLPCMDDLKADIVTYVRQQFEPDYQVDTLDGARIHFDEGWAMVRQSNTQPVISMRFEARTARDLERIQSRVQSLVEAEIERRTGGVTQ